MPGKSTCCCAPTLSCCTAPPPWADLQSLSGAMPGRYKWVASSRIGVGSGFADRHDYIWDADYNGATYAEAVAAFGGTPGIGQTERMSLLINCGGEPYWVRTGCDPGEESAAPYGQSTAPDAGGTTIYAPLHWFFTTPGVACVPGPSEQFGLVDTIGAFLAGVFAWDGGNPQLAWANDWSSEWLAAHLPARCGDYSALTAYQATPCTGSSGTFVLLVNEDGLDGEVGYGRIAGGVAGCWTLALSEDPPTTMAGLSVVADCEDGACPVPPEPLPQGDYCITTYNAALDATGSWSYASGDEATVPLPGEHWLGGFSGTACLLIVSTVAGACGGGATAWNSVTWSGPFGDGCV